MSLVLGLTISDGLIQLESINVAFWLSTSGEGLEIEIFTGLQYTTRGEWGLLSFVLEFLLRIPYSFSIYLWSYLSENQFKIPVEEWVLLISIAKHRIKCVSM